MVGRLFVLLREDVDLEPLLEEQEVLVLDVMILQLSLLIVFLVELLVDLLLHLQEQLIIFLQASWLCLRLNTLLRSCRLHLLLMR